MRASLGGLRIKWVRVNIERAAASDACVTTVGVCVPDAAAPRVAKPEWREIWKAHRTEEPPTRSEIRDFVLEALEHEVDHFLRVDGELVTDAHPIEVGLRYDDEHGHRWAATRVDYGKRVASFERDDGEALELSLDEAKTKLREVFL